ncbi:cryptochrome, partial [Tremellales sp. Uapishka_1]
MASRILYWHRTDLRLTDSPALAHALSLPNIEAFYPIFTFDPTYIYGHRVGVNRFSFLLESLQDLSAQYSLLNLEQKLHVLRGKPDDILGVLWKEWGITHMVWEKDDTAYGGERDALVRTLAEKQGILVEEKGGRHLFDPKEVVGLNHGKPTMTLHQWQGIAKKLGAVSQESPAPTEIPSPGGTSISAAGRESCRFVREDIDLNAHIRTGVDSCYDHLTGPNGDFAVPTLSSLGFAPATTTIQGGTTSAHVRLALFLSQPEKVAKFSKPHSSPTSLEPSTTLLSPYIKFGCVGVREIWWGCKRVIAEWERTGGRGSTKEPENMFGQLEFRDMYACAEIGTKEFQRIRGNKICRYIDWGLQNQYNDEGKEILPRPSGDAIDEERFAAWKDGRTGFPWIDACMRQLRVEGWIHHLARHSVACYLTRGQCYISWERGMEVFDEWLIDWDPASNPGNWMWLSCSAFFSQYFRVYGLVSWPLKTDKHGDLVRKYCPELKDFPDKYIYAPHLAPEAVQKASNCIIGQDYPFPILDEQEEKTRCIARIKNALALGLHGDAKEVMDGSAAGLLHAKHESTGAFLVKNEKEVKEEKGEAKRKREGNASLDGFVKKLKAK